MRRMCDLSFDDQFFGIICARYIGDFFLKQINVWSSYYEKNV